MSSIHSTAIVDRQVELDSSVEVGPYSIITGNVKIGKGTVVSSHTRIGNSFGKVTIGEGNQIHAGSIVGGPPQDVSYKNEPTEIIIGNNNIIREFTTLNCGTQKGGGQTVIGNGCMLMAYVHVAHDCKLGDNVIVANTTQFAGHVEVGNNARIGGMVGIAQFVKIGRYAYIGGGARINKDILPFSIAEGSWARVRAANKVGLTRAGFQKEDINNIYRAIKIFIMSGLTVEETVQKIKSDCGSSAAVAHLVQFIQTSENGVAR
jgi:UDP-N-acetylglucosamine acyltransferase